MNRRPSIAIVGGEIGDRNRGQTELFDPAGALIDDESRKRVQGCVQGFCDFVGNSNATADKRR